MSKKVRNKRPAYITEIIKRLDRIEKKLNALRGPSCIDFTMQNTGTLPNPYTKSLLNYTFTFFTRNSLGLEVKPNAPSNTNGLRIPYDLTVEISPPCQKAIVEISSFSRLVWEAFDSNGNPLTSIPPPPAPNNTPGFKFDINGGLAKLKFESQNEEDIKTICCYDE